MQLVKLLPAIAAAAFVAAPAFAATTYQAQAKLAAPASAPATATIGEAAWHCDGDACVGESVHKTLDNPVRECRKVAAQLGVLAAYETHGQKLDAGDLKACNVAAKAGGAATAGK
ncbi:MAG: CC_3452 family protein [Phenylobacterium sp.]|jgi:hypothetical protein